MLKEVSDGERRLSKSLSESSGEEDELTVKAIAVSGTFGEGTGREEEDERSSNRVWTF